MEELKPCPFCGDKKPYIWHDEGMAYVSCRNCLAEGPVANMEEEAVEAWNSRTEEGKENNGVD